MMELDCRGLNCPEPVLRTKKALAENPGMKVTVLVDNQTARDNVMRFAKNQGKTTEVSEKEGSYRILVIEDADHIPTEKAEIKPATNQPTSEEGKTKNPVLFIPTNELGKGSSELGSMLMRNYIYTLTQAESPPKAIVLMNAGVNLAVEGSPVLEDLAELEDKGVELLVCGTCLDYYSLKDRHKAGQVSNMYDIAELMLCAERVITL